MNRIAVLMTVHNRKEKTLLCLKRIHECHKLTKYVIDVFLTDDGCTDGTQEAIKKFYPKVVIIKGDGSLFWNRGMIAAWNEAAKSNYDFYLWLNDDTFIYDDVFERLLDCSYNHGNSAIIVGMTCSTGNKRDITYGGWVGGKVLQNAVEENKCETFNGNIVLVPKVVFEILGTNDPSFRHCLGDTDYGLRANEQGIEVWTAKGIMGECDRHEHPTVWMDSAQPFIKRWNNFFSPLGNNPFEFFYFRKKHFGVLAACMTFVSNFAHFLFPSLWKNNC